MNQVLLFLLLGLGTGATIAAIAVGIVVTYRGSGFINLAAGAIAMLAGFSFWALRTGELGFTLSTPPAVVLSYVFVIAISIVIELAVFRPLRSAAPLAKLVASLGVLLTAQASMLLAFGTSQHPQPTIIPVRIVRMLDSAVPLSVFVVSGIVVALTAILWALYRWTRFGLATRAASENDVGARLAGLSPNELSLANTLLANLLLGTLGILAGSVAALDTTTLPFLVVPALAAALFARLTSFWIACLCGLGIGMMKSLIEYASTKSWFPTTQGLAVPGVKELLVFVLIVAAMFLRGASLPTRGELVEQRLPDVPRPKHSVKLAIPATALCAIALVVLPFDFRQALTNSLIGIVMALSLVVITGFVGQISVVQLALAGVAGFTVSHLAVDAGIGFPLAPLVGVAAAVLLGLVTAVSALRVRGVGLAVVTIAAAVAVYNFGFINPTWGGGAIGSPVPDPHLFGINLGPNASFRGLDGNVPSPVFGWVALTAAVLLGLLVVSVRRGILGRRMLAVRSNERAAAGAAINVRNVKLTAFGISALIAGVAGTLYAYNFGSVSADRFSVPLALSLIAFAYTGGITLVSGAVFAGLVAAQGLLPYTLDTWFGLSGNWFLLFGGLILIFTLIQNPDGVAGSFYRTSQARAKRKAERSEPGPARRRELRPRHNRPFRPLRRRARGRRRRRRRRSGSAGRPDRTERCRQDDVHRRDHGVRPIDRPRRARRARSRGAAAARTRAARARPDLAEHRAVRRPHRARESHRGRPAPVVPGPRSGARGKHVGPSAAAENALELLDLGPIAEAMPAEMTQGQRKLVGVARAIAMEPRLLCLDEPAAGLDTNESKDLGQRLRQIADSGTTTLLIDHDMGLVMTICDQIIVLEFGKVIASGSPDEVRRDPRVVTAYLGGAATAERAPASPARSARGRDAMSAGARAREPDGRVRRRRGGPRHQPCRGPGRDRRPARRERRGQDDDAARRLRSRAPARRRDPFPGQDLHRVQPSARAKLGIAHVLRTAASSSG